MDRTNTTDATYHVLSVPVDPYQASSRQNSSSPVFPFGACFFGGAFATGDFGAPGFGPELGLFIDDRAMLISSSSSVTGFDGAGFIGGASLRGAAGAVGVGGLVVPGRTAPAVGLAAGG